MIGTPSYLEKELFILISEGDEKAFELVYNQYLPILYPVVFKIVKSEAAVRDVLQEVFMYLWLDRSKLPEVVYPKSWVLKIAYNRAYTWVRKHMLVSKTEEKAGIQTADSTSNATEDSVYLSETTRLIKEAIRALPLKSRKIYQLSREQGLKSAEIAEVLEITPQAVKNSLVRSAKSIREFLISKGVDLPLIFLFSTFQ